NSVEHRVDVVLRGVADVAFHLRAVEQPGVALAGVDGRGCVRLDGVDAAPDVHHLVDVLFDELHRVHHLADALTGEVWKLQASKIETTRSWISSLSSFCWSAEVTLASALAAWSIASVASRICWVACSVPPTTAPSSPFTLAISEPSKFLPWSTAISRLVRLIASWIRSSSTLSLSHCPIWA